MTDLNTIFTRVTFDGDDRQYHHDLCSKIKTLAADIDANCPNCTDKTLAFNALHLALMHTGAALGQKLKYK